MTFLSSSGRHNHRSLAKDIGVHKAKEIKRWIIYLETTDFSEEIGVVKELMGR